MKLIREVVNAAIFNWRGEEKYKKVIDHILQL